MQVSNADIADYFPRVHNLAARLTGIAGAEYDDLFQTGSIFVWLTLEKGLKPTNELIRARLLDWCRLCRRQRANDTVSYDDYLDSLTSAANYGTR